jgi:hypothetical protein
MLCGVVNSELQIMEFLMLMDVEYIVDLAFRKVIPATVANY